MGPQRLSFALNQSVSQSVTSRSRTSAVSGKGAMCTSIPLRPCLEFLLLFNAFTPECRIVSHRIGVLTRAPLIRSTGAPHCYVHFKRSCMGMGMQTVKISSVLITVGALNVTHSALIDPSHQAEPIIPPQPADLLAGFLISNNRRCPEAAVVVSGNCVTISRLAMSMKATHFGYIVP